MEIEIKKEQRSDHRAVEELTREAFWNHYAPGCDEHYYLHLLRKSPQFIGDLSYVATINSEIVGHIAYQHTQVADTPTLTFGPLSVSPRWQKQGIGARLVLHTLQLAQAMDYLMVVILGDPNYYKRFGFKATKEFGITNSEGRYPVAMQALALQPNSNDLPKGVFEELFAYQPDGELFAQFDSTFPEQEKRTGSASQERFSELLTAFL